MASGKALAPFGERLRQRNEPPLPRMPSGPVRPKTREELLKQAKELETQLVRRVSVPEKLLIQAELGYMRRQLDHEKQTVNLTYPVNPPYAFVQIYFSKETKELQYDLLEPNLKPEEKEQLASIRDKMEAMMSSEELPVTESKSLWETSDMHEYLRSKFLNTLRLYDIDVPLPRHPVFMYYLGRDFVGMGRSDAVLRDPFLEDISCLGPETPLFVFHRVFGSLRTNVAFGKDLELNRYIFRLAQIAGKHISIYQPILDATLRDGSRINLTLGTEVTRKGSTFSVRKFSYDPVSPIDLLRFGSISTRELAYFWTLVDNHRSLLVSGGTASGKTTLLNAVSMFIRPEDKVVSIEDTPEIHIDHQNWIQSVARSGYGTAGSGGGASGVSGISGQGMVKPLGSVTLFDLLVAALRQRPEYVLVGEVRGVESFTLFQAISVGHASMSTIHAGSIRELLHRVENEPMNIPRVLFQALDCVAFPGQVVLERVRARRLLGVTEILEVDAATNELLTNEVFRWEPAGDKFLRLGRSMVLEKIAKTSGKSVEELETELQRKERYLGEMNRLNLNYYKDVSQAIAAYYLDPAQALTDLLKRRAR